MKEYFSSKHEESEIDIINIEDEGVFLKCKSLEGEGKNYVLSGTATIDGEIYRDFKIEFQLLETPEFETIDCIMNMDWDWYDFAVV